jgi:spore maturation protein CgeB
MLPMENDWERYAADVSFVGSLYTEKCKYNGMEENLPPYLRGYVNGIMEAQLKVYGYNFIQEALPDAMIQALKQSIGWFPLGSDYRENDRAIIAQEYIGVKCSELERRRLLSALGKKLPVHLYTLSDTSELVGVINRGPAHSRLDMPMIFKCSKINLNITAKTIRSGLSQRVFDVLGAGGFLIMNYQSEIPEYFEVGKDLDVYDSEEDLLNKCEYYLEHEAERLEIARNGYEKVKKMHTYPIRISEMIQRIV